MSKYSVFMYYDEQDQIYVASVPELQGCMAHGETQEEALKEIEYPNAAAHNLKGQTTR